MIGHEGGGGTLSKCSNHFIIKTYSKLILYKPVGKYQFTMACIRALVMSVYQVISCLILNQTHVMGTQKNRRNESSFKHQIIG